MDDHYNALRSRAPIMSRIPEKLIPVLRSNLDFCLRGDPPLVGREACMLTEQHRQPRSTSRAQQPRSCGRKEQKPTYNAKAYSAWTSSIALKNL
jgi:hypothetical protein